MCQDLPTVEEELDRKLNDYLVWFAGAIDKKEISKREARLLSNAMWDITSGLVNDDLSTLVAELDSHIDSLEEQLPETAVFVHSSGLTAVVKRSKTAAKYIIFKGKEIVKTSKVETDNPYEQSMTYAATLKGKGFFCINV